MAREAASQLLSQLTAEDEAFLVTVSTRAELRQDFTSNMGEVADALVFNDPYGNTSLLDGVNLGLGHLKKAHTPLKALVVVSDGGDNNSRYSEGELLSLLRETDVRIYAIGLFERPRYLEKLADETGGSVIWVRKLSDLPEAMDKLSEQIRNEYRLGYFSNRPQNDGKYHKVRVEAQPPESKQLRLSWRRGYTAP